jgi:hypothetical protein
MLRNALARKSFQIFAALLIVTLFAGWALMPVSGSSDPQSPYHPVPLTIDVPGQESASFRIEVADTEEQRSRGLMFRRSLEADSGMLFVYGAPRKIAMWMKNTYVPLDMIFIGGDGRIVSIGENTVPQSLTPVIAQGPAQFVLEVVAGTSRKLGISAGQLVRHPLIDQ